MNPSRNQLLLVYYEELVNLPWKGPAWALPCKFTFTLDGCSWCCWLWTCWSSWWDFSAWYDCCLWILICCDSLKDVFVHTGGFSLNAIAIICTKASRSHLGCKQQTQVTSKTISHKRNHEHLEHIRFGNIWNILGLAISEYCEIIIFVGYSFCVVEPYIQISISINSK